MNFLYNSAYKRAALENCPNKNNFCDGVPCVKGAQAVSPCKYRVNGYCTQSEIMKTRSTVGKKGGKKNA